MFQIAKPLRSDIPSLLELWRRQYEYHHELDSVYYVAYTDELASIIKTYLEKVVDEGSPSMLVARDGERVCGFITFTDGEDDYLDARIKKYGQIIELFVADDARHQGLGTELMSEVERHFHSKGVTDIKLASSSFNPDAEAFYKSIGFVERQRVFFKRTQT